MPASKAKAPPRFAVGDMVSRWNRTGAGAGVFEVIQVGPKTYTLKGPMGTFRVRHGDVTSPGPLYRG